MEYRNLDLDVFAYQVEGRVERFQVRVAASPAGEQKINAAEQVELPAGIRTRLRRLERRQLDLQQMIALGEELGQALFPPGARSFLTRSRERLDEGQALRIRLRLDTLALADLPWEYTYIPRLDTPEGQKGPDGFLVLDRQISLVRYEIMGQASGELDELGPGGLRMVVLLSNPRDPRYAELKLDVERQKIDSAVRDTPFIHPEYYPEATIETLEDALVKTAHVFHFSGHAMFDGDMSASFSRTEGKGYLVLQNEDRSARPFPADKLAQNLRGRGVRLAVLGACEASRRDQVNAWTGVAPALTRAGIPAVVGMQWTIRDDNAIAFTRRLYRALAAGEPIDAAVTDGRLAILNRGAENERDWGVPVLYLHAESGVLFPVSGAHMLAESPGDRSEKVEAPAAPQKAPKAGSVIHVGAAPAAEVEAYARQVADIRRQFGRGRLLFFLGADLPESLSGLPSQQTLADALAAQQGLPTSGRLADVSQQVMSHGNRWEFTEFLRTNWEVSGRDPGPLYLALASLVKASKPELIVTTAPHQMLEKALDQAGDLPFNALIREENLAFVDPDRLTLLKLYGDLTQPDTLVVTEQDLNALVRGRIRGGLVEEVRRAFRRNSVLFLGFDLDDPAVMALFDEVAGDRFQMASYAVWSGLATRQVESLEGNRGLQVLDVDPQALLQALGTESA